MPPSSWTALHASLLARSARLSFHTDFRIIRSRDATLAGFADAGALLTFLHGQQGTSDDRDAILRALVVAAQRDEASAGAARELMLLVLWPGMDAIRGRLGRHFRDRDELAGAILAEMSLAIRRLDLAKVRRIAATLLLNVRRDLVRTLKSDGQRAAHRVELTDDLPDDRPSIDHEGRLAALVPGLEAAIGEDAWLVLWVVVEGYSQREAGARLGIGEAAARKRFQRAIRRLRARMDSPDCL